MATNNWTVWARKPHPQATGKIVSPYLKMEFLVVKVRNSQEGVKKRSFRLIRIVFILIVSKITSSNFGTYTITLVKII